VKSDPLCFLFVLDFFTEPGTPRSARAVHFCIVYPGHFPFLVAGDLLRPSFSAPTAPG
jgi:hypothetical protein